VEDLEWIAQQHSQRADRLNSELAAARDQVEVLKRTVVTLELQTDKDSKLTETISNLKHDIQQVSCLSCSIS